MSVRSGIIAVLSLGPAYGLQLHGELEHRMERVGSINVGQIYSTLDRLQAHGLVRQSGTTDDGLPLYSLTDDGLAEAQGWLVSAPTALPDWPDFVGHVLLACSVPGGDPDALIASYRALLRSTRDGVRPDAAGAPGLGDAGRRLLAAAATDWLELVEERSREGGLEKPLGELRPRRGRRPRSTPPPALRTPSG